MTDVEIIKVPLLNEDSEKSPEEVPKFKRMPVLYLELMENRSKIKPDLINKPYEPSKRDLSTAEVTPTPPTPPTPIADTIAHASSDSEDDEEEKEEDEPEVEDPPAPTLSELQAKNPDEQLIKKEYTYPRVDDEETVKKKNEVFFHYQVLKRMHPNAPIPEFNVHSDPDLMSQKYQNIAKKLALDSSVENWKRYMIIFVMGLEVVLGKMSFDVEGFAQQQLVQMHTYDSLLVEMAEKSYTPKGVSRWPVEMRLMMMLTVNMALFIICRMIEKKTGTNLLGTINQMTGQGMEKLMRSPTDI